MKTRRRRQRARSSRRRREKSRRRGRKRYTREHRVITQFRALLARRPVDRMYVTEMIDQIPPGKRYDEHRLRDVEDMFRKLNKLLTTAPDFNETRLVGTPLSAIILWTMGTPAGLSAYRRPSINKMFKKVLKKWAVYLGSPASRYVLNKGSKGWLSKKALRKIKIEDYRHDPKARYFGFRSWNDFFTRELAPHARPITSPNDPKVIVSGCDCAIYKIARNAQKYSKFWIKSQPYSLMDMLDHDTKYVERFIGGDVFQAFLNPFQYHRWHSPISGVILKAYVKEGLYFSQRANQGRRIDDLRVVTWIERSEDPNDQDASEGYIAQVQTRALFYIKSDDPAIGTVCFMPIGMVEISSCIIRRKIKAGYRVQKGEEVGHFQFGGSTSCIIFQKGAIKKFTRTKGVCLMGTQIALAR